MANEVPVSAEASPIAAARVDWVAVAVYYGIACLVSWPFFWWRDMATESWRAWQVPNLLKTASIMWGPGIAALVCLLIFRRRHRRRITLLGTSWWRSLAFYLGPLALFAAAGGRFEGMNGPAVACFIAVVAFTSIFGEELGWRGFLQDALRPLAPGRRYLLIGVLWEFWHFTNRTHSGSIIRIAIVLAISYPVVIGLAWLIGEATERSRSLLVASSLHLWVNLVFESFEADPLPAVGALLLSLVLWGWLLRDWGAATRPASAPTRAGLG